MTSTSKRGSCPDPSLLAGLLGDDLSESERSALTAHLDSCSPCQHSLDRLADDGSTLIGAVREAAAEKPPASRSAYWRAVDELAHTPPPSSLGRRAQQRLSSFVLSFLEPTTAPGQLGRLGHFDVETLLGRGGMGLVLRAFDTHLQRHVAIKVLDPELADDPTARKRFCREARTAASVTHENVVTIYHVEKEETSGLPFFVMQIVAGESLQDRLDRVGALPLVDILQIGLQTAVGLAAAHAKGLVHRDIKPANILLEGFAANKSANGSLPGKDTPTHAATTMVPRVKLTDFGLARATEDVRLTQSGFVSGTPLYMSPEQARGVEVDHRSDLYSLGAVLYHMATGKPPFESNAPLALLRRVEQEHATPVRGLNPAIPADLAGLIEGLLAKDPGERFQSAAEVAASLADQLAHVHPGSVAAISLPVVERRSDLRFGVRRRAGRYWMLAALVTWTLMGVLAVALAATELLGRTHLVASLLKPNPDAPNGEGDISEAELILNGNSGPIWSTRFAPDGRTVAMAIDDGTIKLWDAHDGHIKRTVNAHKGPIWRLAYDRAGKQLATAGDDSTVKIWDTVTWQRPRTLKHDTAVRAVAFAPSCRTVATGTRNGVLRIWDLDTGKAISETPAHDGVIYGLAVSPDGQMIASTGVDKLIKLWSAATGEELVTLRGHIGPVYTVAFSPDSKILASGGWDRTVRLWEAASGNSLGVLQGHAQDVWSVAFSPDGAMLASASEDHTTRLWDVAGRVVVRTLRGSSASLYTAAFAPDAHTLAAGGRDGMVRLWACP